MTWAQPVCEDRFWMLFPDNDVSHLIVPETQAEPCCFCGRPTRIYVRIDPATVPHPRTEP
jgi:hypothetical protein